MALGKEVGDYSFKMTSATHAEDGSGVTLNFDGTATNFGTVLGTLIARGEAADKKGPCSWRAQAFLDSGDQAVAIGEGTWEEVGKHQWRIRLVNQISDGQTIAGDGQLDLATRSFSGKLIEWS